MLDFGLFAESWQTQDWDLYWNPECDQNNDGIVDIDDLMDLIYSLITSSKINSNWK